MPSFNFRRWISGSKQKPVRRERGRYQLNVEPFEDRLAPAGIFTWVGGGANSNWATTANWQGGIVPGGTDGLDQLVFAQANAVPTNLPSTGTFQSITFGASGVNLNGSSTFTISSGVTVNAGISNTQIGINLNLAGAQTFKVGSGSDLSTFGLTVNGRLSGTNSLTINGPGTLQLTADNSTFSGALALPKPVSIGAAIVQITNAKALGTGQVTISDGSELDVRLSATGTIANTLFVTGAGAFSGAPNFRGALNVLAGSAATTWSGPITLTGPTDTVVYSGSSNSFIISGVVSDSGSAQNLIKEGSGTITLTNSNTYRGATTINDGMLVVQNNLALGTGTANVTVNYDGLNSRVGSINLDGGVTVTNRNLHLNGRGNSGTLRSTNGTNTWAGNITLDGGAFPNDTTVDFVTTSNSTLIVSGSPGAPTGTPAISGTGATFVNVRGGGTTVFATANSFSATIQVSGNSTLEIRDSMALGTITAGNTQVVSGSTLRLAGGSSGRVYADSVTGLFDTMQISESLSISGSGVTISGQNVGGLYSQSGINSIVRSISLSGAIGVARPGTTQNPNLPSGYPYNYDISGVGQMLDDGLTINGTFTASSFTKLGLGQLYLPNANTGITTNTTISAGSITIGQSSSLGSVNASTSINSQLQTTVADGATLNLLSLGTAGQGQQQTVTLANANLLNGSGNTSNFRLIVNGIATANIPVGSSGATVASELALVAGGATFSATMTNPSAGVYVYVITVTNADRRQLPQIVGISAPGLNALNTGAVIQAAITRAGSAGPINIATQLNLNGSGATSPYQVADIPNYDFTNKTTAPLMNLAGANTISGRIQLVTSSAIGVEQAYSSYTNNVNYASTSFSQLTTTGPISESATNTGLAKVGSQRLIIQGAGTYTGDVDIKQGTILLQNDTGLGSTPLGSISSSVTVPSPIHVYDLNGSYADSMGGPAIAPFGAGGVLTGSNYQFPDNRGLELANSALPNSGNYSIEMVFNISDISSYVNLIEFKNRTSDKGLYNLNGALTFYNAAGANGPAGTISNNTNIHLVLTRDSVTKLVVAYINGVQQFSFTDTPNEADFGTNPLHFFIDDTVVPNETSPGVVDRIRIFSSPLSAGQVASLYAGAPTTPGGGTTTTVFAGASLELGSTSPATSGGIARGLQIANETLVLNGTGNSLFGDSPLTILSATALSNVPPSVNSPIVSSDHLWLSNINLNTFADRYDLTYPANLASLSAAGTSGLEISTKSLILTPNVPQPASASFDLTYGASTVTVAWDPNPTQLKNNIQQALNQLIPSNTPTVRGASATVFDLVFPVGNYLPLTVSAGANGIDSSIEHSLKFSGSLTNGSTFTLGYGASTVQVTFSTNGSTLLNRLNAAFASLIPGNVPTLKLSGPNTNYGVFNIPSGTRLNLAGTISDTANADVNGSDLAIVGTGIGATASSELNLSGSNTYRGTALLPQGLVAVVQNGLALGSAGIGQQQTLTVPTFSIATATTAGTTTATITTTAPHGFAMGQTVHVSGASIAGYNGTFTIASVTANSFTYTLPATLGDATGGAASVIAPFTLTFTSLAANGAAATTSTTAAITYTANAATDAAEIAAKLNAIASITGVGGVVEVTPSSTPGVFVITLKGALSGFHQNLMTVSEPTATIAITREGGGGTVVFNGASLQTKGNITVAGEPLVLQGNGVAVVTPTPNQWFAVGPTPVVGSLLTPNSQTSTGTVTSVAYDRLDATGNTYYVTSSDGGAWKTLDGGQTWTPLFDLQTSGIFAGSIAVSPVNSNILYLGTGESRNDTNNFYGSGVYRSTNAGRTWTLLTQNVTANNTNTQTAIATSANPFAFAGTVITKVVPDPLLTDTVYVSVSNGAYVGINQQQNPNAGVWRYDGTTWTNLSSKTSSAAVTISTATRSGTTATVTTTGAHGLAVGQTVMVGGVNVAGYNGAFAITAVTGTTFSYTVSNTIANSATGGFATARDDSPINIERISSVNQAIRITVPNGNTAPTVSGITVASGTFSVLSSGIRQGSSGSSNNALVMTFGGTTNAVATFTLATSIGTTATITWDPTNMAATEASFQAAFGALWNTFSGQPAAAVSADAYVGITINPADPQIFVQGETITINSTFTGYDSNTPQTIVSPVNGTFLATGQTINPANVILISNNYAGGGSRFGQNPASGNGYISGIDRRVVFPTQGTGTNPGVSYSDLAVITDPNNSGNRIIAFALGTPWGGANTNLLANNNNTRYSNGVYVSVNAGTTFQEGGFSTTSYNATYNAIYPTAGNIKLGLTSTGGNIVVTASIANPTINMDPALIAAGYTPSSFYRTQQNTIFFNGSSAGPNGWNLGVWTTPTQPSPTQLAVLGNVPVAPVVPPLTPPDGQFGQIYSAFVVDPSNANRAFVAGVGSGATVGSTANVILQYNGAAWTDITAGGTGPGAGVTSLSIQTVGATTYLLAGTTRGFYRYNLATSTWSSLNGNLGISQFNSIASNPTAVSPYTPSSTFGGLVNNDVAVYGSSNTQSWNYLGTNGSSPMPSLLSGTQVAYDPNNSQKMFKSSTSVSATTTSAPGTTVSQISEVVGGYNPPGPGGNQFVGYYYEVRVASLSGISTGTRVTISGTTNFNGTFVVHRTSTSGGVRRFYFVYLDPNDGSPVLNQATENTGLISLTSPAVPKTTTALYSSPNGGTTWNAITPPGATTVNNYWVNPITGNLIVLTTNSINAQTVYSVGNPTSTSARTNTNLLGGAGSFVAGAVYQGLFQADTDFPTTGQNAVIDLGANAPASGTIYTLSANGELTLTKNGGVTWVTRSVGDTSGMGGTASSLTVDPSNSYTVYVTTTSGEVWKTTDAGLTWTNLAPTFGGIPTGPLTMNGTTASPTDAPIWSLALDPRSGNLYVGTDQGVYYLTPSATSWQVYGTGLPSVQVRTLDLNQSTNTLTIGTYGRGAFATSLPAAPANSGGLVADSGSTIWSGPVILAGKTTIGALGTQTVQNGISSASLNVQGTIADLSVTPSYANETANGVIANTSIAELTKSGFGVVILSGANQYAGVTDIKEGVLTTNNVNALRGTATVVRAGAALQLLSSLASEPIYLFGNGIQIDGHNTGALRNVANNNTYSGTIHLRSNSTIGVDTGASLTIGDGTGNGTITDEGQGFSVVKESTGTLIYNGANTYGAVGTLNAGTGTAGTGATLPNGQTYLSGTVVSQGRLLVKNEDALNNYPDAALNTTTVLDGAQLVLQGNANGGINVVQNLNLSGTGNANTGALYSISDNNTVTGTVTLSQNAAFSPTSSAPTTVNIGVEPAANGSTGTLIINGPIQEQIVGPYPPVTITYLTQGLQNLTISANALTPTGTVSLAPVVNSAGTSSVYTLVFAGNITGGTFTLRDNNSNQTAQVSWNGAGTLISRIEAALANIGNYTRVSSGLGLNKVGQGTLVLKAPVAFNGETKVSTGILELDAGGTYGTIAVSNGATLDLNAPTLAGINVVANVITNGTGFGGVGVVRNLQGNNTLGGTLTLQTNSTVNVTDSASPLTVSGAVQDFTPVSTPLADLTKAGPGTLILPSNNTYGGNTTISQGTISARNSAALGAAAVAQVQHIVVVGSTLGSFSMTYAGQPTASISLNQLSPANLLAIIQRELNLLMQNVGVGGTMVASNLTQSGSLLTFDVTLGGTYFGFNQPNLGGSGSSSPLVSFSATTSTYGHGGVEALAGGTLNVDGNNLSISNKPLRLTSGTLSGSTGSNTYSSGITLNGATSTISASTGATLTVDKAIVQSVNNAALDVNGPGSVAFTEGGYAMSVTSVSGRTVTVSAPGHNFIAGQRVQLDFGLNSPFNGVFTVTSAFVDTVTPANSTFTYTFSTVVPLPAQVPSGAGSAFASNTYTGLTKVGGQGTLTVGKSGSALGITGNVQVGDGNPLNADSTLRLQDNNDLNSASTVTVLTDGNFDLNAFNQTIAGLTINSGKVTIPGASTLTLNGNVSANSDGTGPAHILGAGSISLGGASRDFTVADGTAATDLEISTLIAGSVSDSFVKKGLGRLELDAVGQIFAGTAFVNAGDLQIDSGSSLPLVGLTGGTLSGTGTVGNVNNGATPTVGPAAGTINPGYNGTANPRGTLTISGTPTWSTATTLHFDLEHTSNDQIAFTSGNLISFGNAVLDGFVSPNVKIGDLFTIITSTGGLDVPANDPSKWLKGQDGLGINPIPNDGKVFIGGSKFKLTYQTNAVVLERVRSDATVAVTPSSGNPVYGATRSLTITVTPEAGAMLPTSGKVEVTIDIGTTPTVVSLSLDVNGQATFDPQDHLNTTYAVGSIHTVDVIFYDDTDGDGIRDAFPNGDPNSLGNAPFYDEPTYNIALGNHIEWTIAKNSVQVATSTTPASSASSPAFGAPLTVHVDLTPTAALTTDGALKPAGNVTFTIDSDATEYDVAVNQSTGRASLDLSTLIPPQYLSVGNHTIHIKYNVNGTVDGNYEPITTAIDYQITIVKDSAAFTITPTPSPSTQGAPVSFLVEMDSVASNSVGIPSGSVSIYDGTAIPANLVGQGTLDSSGNVTISVNSLTVGTHSLTFVYGGDGNYNTNTTTRSFVVNNGQTTTTVAAQSAAIQYGTTFTVQANVAAVYPTYTDALGQTQSWVKPSGQVEFWRDAVGVVNGGTLLGAVTMNQANGAAFANVSGLAVGSYQIFARYLTNNPYESSTSAAQTFVVSPAPTTVTFITVPGTTSYGQNATFQVGVTSTVGTPNAVGTLELWDMSTNAPTGVRIANPVQVDSLGRAQFTVSTLTPGSHVIEARYTGAGNYASSTGQLSSYQVNKATAQVTVSANPNSGLQFGQTVSFTATLTANNGGPSTGIPLNGTTVTFTDGVGGATLGSGTISGGVVTINNVSGLTVGSHTIVAAFPGDTFFNPSNGTLSYSVAKAGTSTGVSVSGTQEYGRQLDFAVTVTSPIPGAGTPTGTVTLFDALTSQTVGSGTLVNGQYVISSSSMPAGTRTLTISFSGSGPFANSQTTLTNFAIAKTGTTVAAPTTSATPVAAGQAVTFSAQVTSASGIAVNAGTVTFFSDGVQIGSPQNVNSTGLASFTTSTLSQGSHTITAQYNVSSNFFGSAVSNGTTQVILRSTNIATVFSPTSPTYGQTTTAQITITPSSGTGTPTGNVTLFEGVTNLGTFNLVSGVASVPLGVLTAGTHNLAITYNGDATFGLKTSSASITVNQLSTTVTLPTSLTTSPWSTAQYGQTVNLQATVNTPSGSPAATVGVVTFFSDGVQVGTVTLNGSNVATLPINTLSAGSWHKITASYSSSAAGNNFAASTTATHGWQETRYASSSVAVTSNPAGNSVYGQTVTFTATVSGAPSGTAPTTGWVEFTDGNTHLGWVQLNGSNVANFTTTAYQLGAGSRNIWAQFGYNPNFYSSAWSSTAYTVAKATPNVAISFPTGTSVLGQPATLVADVTVPVGQAIRGNNWSWVNFYDDATSTYLGYGWVEANGRATLTTTALPLGNRTIRADFRTYDSSNINNATSTLAGYIVTQTGTTTNVTSSPGTWVAGQQITFNASVTATNGSTPVGQVRFTDTITNTVINTVNLVNGQASIQTTFTAGNHAIKADFLPTNPANFPASSFTTATQNVRNDSNVALSANMTSGFSNDSITFTMLVTGSAGTPTGTITLYDGSSAIATLNLVNGAANYSTTLIAGSHTLTATYNGSGTYANKNSNAVVVTISPGTRV